MDQAGKGRRGLWQFIEKYGAICLVLVVVTGVCFLFASRKSGMFIDEIYTYGLSNSHYAPFLDDVKGGSLVDQTVSRQELLDYMMVNPGESFDFGSVYYNQVNDVHPPLYYWLFNMASSLTPGVFSKWTGLALDYALYMVAVVLLYLLSLRLFDSRWLAAAAAALYGLSVIGLSTMVMIRMYVLLTALSVLLAYLVALLINRRRLWLCPLIGFVIFLGLMTQYYFVFYAFFLCGFFVLYALFAKEFKLAGIFSLFAFGGVALLLLVFPACLDHLFAEKLVSGGNALENLMNFSAYVSRLYFFVMEVLRRMKAAVYIAALSILALALCFKKLLAAARERKIHFSALLLILPAFVAFVIEAIISPVVEIRYVYNLAPFFVLAVCFLLHMLERSLGEFKFAVPAKYAAALCILALALWEARCLPPDYLYPEHNDYNALLTQHAAAPCVYMTDDYFPPVTQDLLMLMNFDEFFITGDPASPALDEYLASFADATECVVFIDVNAFWSSGFDAAEMLPELIEETPFTGFEPLYTYGLSETYLLTMG